MGLADPRRLARGIGFGAGVAGTAAAGFDTPDQLLDRYARAAHELGEQDVAEVPLDPPAEAVRYVVIGTLLLEPVLLALRRLAQEDVSRRSLSE